MPVIKNNKVDLRGKYKIYLKISMILSLSLMIAAFKFSPQIDEKVKISDRPQDIIKVEDIINTVQNREKPKPPERPKIIIKTDEMTEDIELSDISIDEDADLDKPPTLPDKHKIIEDEPFIDWAEEMPEPIGGLETFQEKVEYTEIAVLARIEGKVIIEAWIDKEGNVAKAFIIKDIGGGLGDSALNAVLSTKFLPGKQRGIPVKVKINIPIKFVLK